MLPASLLSSIKTKSSSSEATLRAVPASERRDRSNAKVSLQVPDASDNDEAKAREYFFDSGIVTWYETISDCTFSTSFCEVSPTEAQLFIEHWEKQVSAQQGSYQSFDPQLLEEAKSKLSNLRDRLHQVIQTEASKSAASRVFVKLSTRSPKDSKRILAKAAVTYKERISAMEGGDKKVDSNERWRILSEEVASASAVANVDDAMEMLLDSERVYEDFKYALEGEQERSDWKVFIVARAWDPRVKPHTEFRAICWGSKLTCLWQYFHPLFFPHLLVEKDEVLKDILACFEDQGVQKAVHSLGGHCIVDFSRVSPGETLIVELNPFDGIGLGTFPASTGLFLWDDPADKKIMKGEASFEFRIRETPSPEEEMKKRYNTNWRAIIY